MLNILHQYDKDNLKKPGFGDFLKGCMFLHQQQQIYNFNLDIDFSKHPLGNFIKSTVINKDLINIKQQDLLNNCNFFYLFNSNGDYNILCNSFYNTPLNENTKIYMKNNVLNFTESILKDFELLKEKLNIQEEYSVIQLRTTDHNFGRKYSTIPLVVSNFIENNKLNNMVCISNNYSLKQVIQQTYTSIKITNFNPIHLGVCGKDLIDMNYKLNDIKNTLLEFILLINAKTIYSYSEYGGPSAFIKTVIDIYDIPHIYIS